MRGHRWAVLAAVGAALVVAAPAPAEEDKDEWVAWSEPCGDAATLLRAGDTRVAVGDSSTSPLDIRAVEMRWIRGGVRMQMDVCGPLTGPENNPRSWSVTGSIDNGCFLQVQLADSIDVEANNSGPSATPVRAGRVYVSCPDGLTGYEMVANVRLPREAWSVDGSRVTVRLLRSQAGAAAPYLPAGTIVRSLHGSTYDVRSSPIEYFNPQYTTVELHGAGRDAADSDLSISLG